MSQESNMILTISKQLLHTYFEETRLDLLFSYMAPDIIWLGAGKNMSAKGYDAVTSIFLAGHNQLIPCTMRNEEYLLQRLGPGWYLCQGCCDLETLPTTHMYLHEYQRCVFIFRHNTQATNDTGWELTYLHNSMAYNALKDNELFALTEGFQNYQRLHAQDLSQLSATDKNQLYSLIRRSIYEPLDPDTQEFLMIMSLFKSFTTSQAVYMWRHIDTQDMLEREATRNAFIHFDYPTASYSFHPAFADYLQKIFSRQTRSWQRLYWRRAGRWFLQAGNYEQSIQWAWKVRDFSTIMSAVENGGLPALLNHCYDLPAHIWIQCPLSEKRNHIKACCILGFHAFISGKKGLLIQWLPDIQQLINSGTAPILRKKEYRTWVELLYCSVAFHDIKKMQTHIENACRLIPPQERSELLFLPWTFGSPSALSLYHQRPGSLHTELRQLQGFLKGLHTLYTQENALLWNRIIRMEWYYLTGHPDQAQHELEMFTIHGSDVRLQSGTLLSSLFFQARLAAFYGSKESFADAMHQFHRFIPDTFSSFYLNMASLCQSFLIALTEPSEEQIENSLQAMQRSTFFAPCQPFAQLIHDRLLLARGSYTKVSQYAQKHTDDAIAASYILIAIYESLFAAIAFHYLNAPQKAGKFLKQAIDLAIPDHIIMPFAEHMEYIEPLLSKLMRERFHLKFIREIRTLSMTDSLANIRGMVKAGRDIPYLSEREHYIATLVTAGITNKDIARDLNVAEVTIKKTLSRIYTKLGIPNRTALTSYMKNKPQ